jgi:hypothetical protein
MDALGHESMNRSDALDRRGISVGDDPRSALSARFELLTRISGSVIVVDPFALTDFVRSEARSQGQSGLARLLTMAAVNGVSTATVVTSASGSINGRSVTETSLFNAAQALLAPLSGAGLTVSVRFVASARTMHDRWLGFSWGSSSQASFTIGRGLSSFDGTTVTRTAAVSRVDDAEAFDVAHQLLINARPPRELVVG